MQRERESWREGGMLHLDHFRKDFGPRTGLLSKDEEERKILLR